MAISLNGSNGLRHTSRVIASGPVSMFIWVRRTSGSGVDDWFAGLGANTWGSAGQGAFQFEFNTTNIPAVWYGAQQGNAGGLSSNFGDSGAWIPVLATYSAGSVKLYAGANTTPQTGTLSSSDTFSNHTGASLGGFALGTAPAGFRGHLAEFTVWNTVLSDSDWATLRAGGLPETVQSASLVEHWALRDASDLTGDNGRAFTVNGTGLATATHPITRASPGPTIGTQPSNATVTTPATATFTVAATASGGGTLSYQWQRLPSGGSWANVSTGTGGTTASYTTAATTVSGGNHNNADQYRCLVTETGGTNAGTATSNAVTLTVNAAATGPTINTQPTSSSVTAPATATFTVAATASSGTLSYQWQRSTNSGSTWASVTGGSGGTTASYTTPATSVTGGSANSGDQYRCAVTDSNGTTNSSAATLTVEAAPAVLTSSALKSNAGVLHLSAPFEAFVLNVTTGALVVRKTGLTSNASTGVVTFGDAALTAATQYRVVWRRTDTGAQGVEILTAA